MCSITWKYDAGVFHLLIFADLFVPVSYVNQDHLLPEPYVAAMRDNLLNRCPVSSFDHVKKTVESDFNQGLEELFDHFERTPIASASLAQVNYLYYR